MMVAALVFLLPLSAHSEIKEGSFEVGAFGGYNFFEKGQNLKDHPIYGGQLGYNFTRYFGIEGGAAFINTYVADQTITGNKEGRFISPTDRVTPTFYYLDAVYHFKPDGNFNPFVVAGIGGTHYNPAISTKDMFTFNAGIGAKFWLTDNIALRIDLKDYIVTEVFQETYNNIAATIGITFAFGGKAKPAPTPVAKYEPVSEPKPEPKPDEPVTTPPEPKVVEEKVVILVAEPKVEEKIEAAVLETKAEEKVIVLVLAFEDVHFDFDKSTLKPEAQVILKRNIQMLKDNPKTKIRIAGYTSASGTREYNQKLSERRANGVQKYLIEEGIITQDRLSTIGYGETRPGTYEVAPKEVYSKAAKANMRVLFEIIIVK
jgi:OOP family OmpA-OmpF porin